MSEYFQRKTRDDGETFVSLTNDAPEWLAEAVMMAHDGEMPNDWRYDIGALVLAACGGDDDSNADDDAPAESTTDDSEDDDVATPSNVDVGPYWRDES